MNATDNSTLCTITSAQANAGYDISSCASGVTSIRLYANLTTTSSIPILHDWNVSWTLASVEIRDEHNGTLWSNNSGVKGWTFSGEACQNVTLSYQNPSNGIPTCTLWLNGTKANVYIYASNFTDGNGKAFNPKETEKIVVRDHENTTAIDWSSVTRYVPNKNESSWINFTMESWELKDVYFQLCIPMDVKSGEYSSTFYAEVI
jgi:hypothetical protein